jgi:hypothetical protein
VSRQKPEAVRDLLKNDRPEVRWAAAWVVGTKGLHFPEDLLDLLTDNDGYVRMAARRGLVLLSSRAGGDTGKVDFGPAPLAGPTDRVLARMRWRAWWKEHPHRAPSRTPVEDPLSPANDAEEGADVGPERLAQGLVRATGAEQDELLERLRGGKGVAFTEALAKAIPSLSGTAKTRARDALAVRLSRMTIATLRDKFESDDAEVRRAAVLAVAMKGHRACVPELIGFIRDPEPGVPPAARAALKSLTGQDFGPFPGATEEARGRALAAWRAWWQQQAGAP